jgi:hypothetical protein
MKHKEEHVKDAEAAVDFGDFRKWGQLEMRGQDTYPPSRSTRPIAGGGLGQVPGRTNSTRTAGDARFPTSRLDRQLRSAANPVTT